MRGGLATPLLTGCLLNQVKILHESALFLHKIFKHFLVRSAEPPVRPHHLLFCILPPLLFQISGFATGIVLMGAIQCVTVVYCYMECDEVKNLKNKILKHFSFFFYWTAAGSMGILGQKAGHGSGSFC